jgi:hypothetical protein
MMNIRREHKGDLDQGRQARPMNTRTNQKYDHTVRRRYHAHVGAWVMR